MTKHTVQEQVQVRVLDKLHLQHTYFPLDKLAQLPGIPALDIVHGYNFYRAGSKPYIFQKYGEDVTSFSLSYANSSGAMVSTVSDINRFIHALYHPGELLNAAQIKELTTLVSTEDGQAFIPKDAPDVMGYGLGIFGFYSSQEKNIVYFYQGQTSGFQFVYFYVPATGLYLLFGINTSAPIIDRQSAMQFLHQANQLCQR